MFSATVLSSRIIGCGLKASFSIAAAAFEVRGSIWDAWHLPEPCTEFPDFSLTRLAFELCVC